MSPETRRLVRERAGARCEYCHVREEHLPFFPFHADHAVARQHQGSDTVDNLVWSCPRCNSLKGTNLSSVDPDSLQIVPLFNPRMHRWEEHFALQGPRVAGLTPTGRATAWLLQMNSEARLALRSQLLEGGLW